MARVFEPALQASDLQALGAYEVAAIVALGSGDLARPVTFKTAAPAEPTGSATAALAGSRARYGRPAAEVEADLRARQARPRAAAAPVGRKSRAS
jgi:hypothetical protein